MPKYALIKDGRVLNVLVADSDFISDQVTAGVADSGVDISELLEPIVIGDKYEGGQFVTGLTKGLAIVAKLAQLKQETRDWVELQYDTPTRLNFFMIRALAIEAEKTNRAAYINTLFEWFQTTVEFVSTTATAIQCLATADEVINYQWDFSPLSSTNPRLTLLGALAIND